MSDSTLEVIHLEECLRLLRANAVGRIAVLDDGYPLILPVNYRVAESDRPMLVAIRTRVGNVIDRSGPPVAFEVDGIDTQHRSGWSVVVRGKLYHVVDMPQHSSRDAVDPQPWLHDDRDSWLLIDPEVITGRRLLAVDAEWAFHIRAYL